MTMMKYQKKVIKIYYKVDITSRDKFKVNQLFLDNIKHKDKNKLQII